MLKHNILNKDSIARIRKKLLYRLILQGTFILAFVSFYIIGFLIFTQCRWLILPYVLWHYLDRNTKDEVLDFKSFFSFILFVFLKIKN